MSLVLMGGNEFRSNCVEMDKELLSRIGRETARVVIIPTAGANQGAPMAASNGTRYFAKLGAEASAAMIVERMHADDRFVPDLAEADLIYLAGGNPAYLRDALVGTQALAAMQAHLDRGGMLGGSSAGAMAMGTRMTGGRGAGWMEGWGIAEGVAVLPHHEDFGWEQAKATMGGLLEDGITIFGIDTATAAVSADGRTWEVLGAGEIMVYSPSGNTRYKNRDTFSI